MVDQNKDRNKATILVALLVVMFSLVLYLLWDLHQLNQIEKAMKAAPPLVVDSVTNWPSEPIVTSVKSRTAWTLDGTDCSAIEVDVVAKKVTVVCK